MNFNTSMTYKTERLEDHNSLSEQWRTLDWNYIEKEVNRLQTRIVKATIKGNWNKVKDHNIY